MGMVSVVSVVSIAFSTLVFVQQPWGICWSLDSFAVQIFGDFFLDFILVLC